MMGEGLFWVILLVMGMVWRQATTQGQKDQTSQEECVRLWLQKKPDLLQRFDQNQVKWLCQRTDEWMQTALTPSTPLSDSLTPEQAAYLGKLQCQGAECLNEIKQTKPKGKPAPSWVPSTISGQKPADGGGPGDPGPGQSDALSDVDAFDTVNEELFISTDEARCGERFWIAQTCKFLTNATTPEEVFPDEFQRPKVTAELKQKMQRRLDNRKAKCAKLKAVLVSQNKDWDNVPNCENAVIMMTPQQLIERCKEILEFEKSQSNMMKNAWNFMKKLVGAGQSGGAGGDDTYAAWLDRCRRLKDRLEDKGMSFQSWISQLPKKFWPGRRKRAGPAQGQAVAAVHADFGDLLAVNAPDQRAKRKEYRMLTDDERKRYHAAINKLKTEKIGDVSKYDLLVMYHSPQEATGAHWGPSFLPFHREYLKQYEISLRKVDPSLALPYWDTTLDEGLPTPADSIIWTLEFLGGKEGVVKEGPFSGWTTTAELSAVPGMRQLYRSVGTSPFGGMYKPSDIEFVLGKTSYADLTACVDPTFELVHGIVHMFVGGYMADIGISPNDPAFWMHHNFIDHVWEEFRQSKQTPEQREKDYPGQDKSCNNFHYPDAQMKPFTIRNIDGMSNNYTRDIFFYQPRPRCSQASPNCGSPYLWCDTKASRCLSKVQANGNCTGFENTEICYNGACQNGKCIATGSPVPASTVPTVTAQPTQAPTTTKPAGQPAASTTTIPTATRPTAAAVPATPATPAGSPGTTARPPPAPGTTPAIFPAPGTTTGRPPPGPSTTPARPPAPGTTPARPPPAPGTTPARPPPGPGTTTAPTPTRPPGPQPTSPRPPAPVATTAARQPQPQPATTTAGPARPVTPQQPVGTTHGHPHPHPGPGPSSTPSVPQGTTHGHPHPPTPPPTRPTPMPHPHPHPHLVATPAPPSAGRPSEPGPGYTNASFPVTYVPVTVVRGRGNSTQPVVNAQLKTTGLNAPLGYTQTVDGTVMKDSAYPSYPGASLAKVYDPSKLTGYVNIVQFKIDAKDDKGRPCQLQCYNQNSKQYANCPNGDKFKLSSNAQMSDPLKYANTEKEALEKMWVVSGYRQKVPDYIMFQCQ